MLKDGKKQSFGSLFMPIFMELFLVNLVSVIDTAMVSTVGDNAVGAVGAANAYLQLTNNAMAVVSTGAGAIMSRYVGAGQFTSAVRTRRISCLLNLAVGGIFTAVFGIFAEGILRLVKTDAVIYNDAVDYMRYVGISCVLLALNYVFTAYLRSVGRPRLSFVSATAGNVVNVVLNALFIHIGLGTLGVALATLISRAVTLMLSVIFTIRVPVEKNESESIPATNIIVRSVLFIGLPAAGESFIWTFWNSVNMVFINGMGTDAVNAYSYLIQIANMMVCLVHAYDSASAIMVGWKLGAGETEAAFKVPVRTYKIGVISGFAVIAVIIPTVRPLLSLMTASEAILAYATPIMAIHTLRLFGQMGTNIFGMAIKTAGDARFILIVGLIVMPFWVFVGSYLLGKVLGWGLYGYWLGASLDEVTRAFIMRARWLSRKWEGSRLPVNK